MALVGYYGAFSMARASSWTPLGLRPPTRPASMGGETPGNNYPVQFFSFKKHPIFILLTIMMNQRSLVTKVTKTVESQIQGGILSVNLQLEAQGPMGNPT